jgi:hypothetical protein
MKLIFTKNYLNFNKIFYKFIIKSTIMLKFKFKLILNMHSLFKINIFIQINLLFVNVLFKNNQNFYKYR